MAKYRIKEEDGWFTPQIFRWWLPIWRGMGWITHRGGISEVCFRDIEAATRHICNYKKPIEPPVIKYHTIKD